MHPTEIMAHTLTDSAIKDIADTVDQAEVVTLTKELVRIPSIYRHEHNIAKYIQKKLQGWGIKAKLVPVKGFGPCVVSSLGGTGKRPVILNGHMDTVEVKEGWKHDPFGAKIENGMLYGLGSLDMKSGLAAMMTAYRTIADSKADLACTVKFQAVTGEEDNSAGTRTLISRGEFRNAKAVVVGEGIAGLNAITRGRRGGSYYDITVLGRSAHGSTPHLGVSAISDTAKIISALESMKMRAAPHLASDDGKTLSESQVVLQISGGSGSYSVPDLCTIKMMRATVPGHPIDIADDIKATIRKLNLKSKVKVVLRKDPADLFKPYVTSEDSELMQTTRKWVRRYTHRNPRFVCGLSEADDNKIAEHAKVPVVCFGAGETGPLARYHQAEEAIGIGQLGTAARVYCATVLDLARSA